MPPSKRSCARAEFFACRARGFKRGAGGAIGFGQRGLALDEAIGGVAAARFRGRDLVDQCAALLFEQARGIFESCAFAPDLFGARLQRVDLPDRAFVALAPGAPIAGDRGEPAGGNLRLARQRLRFRPHLGQPRALTFDLAAYAGELRLDIGGRRQRAERAVCFLAPGDRLVAARRQSCRRLAERRKPRRIAADLAFGVGLLVARGEGLVLERAPAAARGGLGLGGGCGLRLGLRHGRLLGLDLAAQDLELRLDIRQTVLARQAAGSTGRRVGGDREAVPAPEIPVPRDQALAGLEHRREASGLFAGDDPDLGEASRQLRRRRDVVAQRFDAGRQRGIRGIDGGARPAHGRGRIDRSFEIVAQRRPQRCLVALVDGEIVDHGRP